MRRTLLSMVFMGLLVAPGAASALDYAPVDRPGPQLQVPQAQLDASLHCSGAVAGAIRNPVLLIPGTAEDPASEYDWNYEPALTAASIPWCAVTLPNHGMDDIQIAGEFVVNAIREMNQLSGRKIAIIGHSQGGMLPRWALRFWPDTRAMVEDLIALAPSNHGTINANGVCAGGCAASVWQQRSGSEFITALNSFQETFAGISYTVAYTHTDEIVVPNIDSNGSSSLHGGDGDIANIAIQEVCPLNVNEHFAIGTIDPVGYALAIDALDNSGPADKSRIAAAVCLLPFMPAVDPVGGQAEFDSYLAATLANFAGGASVAAEPPLQCYVTIVCRASGGGTLGADGGGAYGPAKSACKRKKRKRGHRQRRKSCKRKKHRKNGRR